VTIFGNSPEESIEINQMKELFKLHNVNFRLINILEGTFADMDIRITFKKMCGFNDIPAIFVGLKYLGGVQDLKSLENRGLLEEIMKEVKVK
jgi:glutaredoxin-related protein